MAFPGKRRSWLISLAALVVLGYALWQAGWAAIRTTLRALGPQLLQEIQDRTGREITVESLDYSTPGLVRVRGARIAREKQLADGLLARVDRMEIRYDPALLDWFSILTRGFGRNTGTDVVMEGLDVYATGLRRTGPVVRIGRARARYDLAPALRGDEDLLSGLGPLALERVRTRVVRDRQGRLDAARWFPEDVMKKPITYRGRIRIRELDLTLEDHRPGALPVPALNRGLGDADVFLTAPRRVRVQSTLRVLGPQGGDLALAGHLDTERDQYYFTLDVRSAALQYWYPYFVPRSKELKVDGGALAGRIALWGPSKTTPEGVGVHLILDVEDGRGRMEGLQAPISGFRGRVSVAGEEVRVDARALAGRLPLRLTGGLTAEKPETGRWRLDVTDARWSQVRELSPEIRLPKGLWIPPDATASVVIDGGPAGWRFRGTARSQAGRYEQAAVGGVRASFQGTLRDDRVLALTGSAHFAGGRWRQVRTGPFTAEFRLRNDLGWVRSAVPVAGGTIAGEGWVRLGEHPVAWARGRARGLELPRLVGLLPEKQRQELPEVVGVASATFTASWRDGRPEIRSWLEAGALAVDGQRVGALQARVHGDGQSWRVLYGRLVDRDAVVSFQGTYLDGGSVRLTVQSSGAELGPLARRFGIRGVEGTGWLHAQVSGLWPDLSASGRIHVARLVVSDLSADSLDARFETEGTEQAQLFHLKLITPLGEMTANRLRLFRPAVLGPPDPARLSNDWWVDGELQVEPMRLERLLLVMGTRREELEQQGVAGDVELRSLRLLGPAHAPEITLDAEVPRLVAAGLDLGRTRVAASADLSLRRVELRSLDVEGELGRVTATGRLTLPRDLRQDPLERTRSALNVRVEGAPVVALLQRFAPEAWEAADLRGSLGFEGRVEGPIRRPEVSGELRMVGLRLNGEPAELSPVQLAWGNEVLLLRDVSLAVRDGALSTPYLAVRADRVPGTKKREVRWAAREITARAVPFDWVRRTVELTGWFWSDRAEKLRTASLDWDRTSGLVSGTIRQPTAPMVRSLPEAQAVLAEGRPALAVEGDLQLTGLEAPSSWQSPPIDLAAEFGYANDRVTLRRAELKRRDGPSLLASGSVGVGERPESRGLALQLQARDFPLQVLRLPPFPDLSGGLLEQVSGALDGTAALAGTRDQPEATFSVSVRQPVVSGIRLDRVELTNGRYDGKQEVLSLGSLTLERLGEKPDQTIRVAVSGSVPLTWPELESPPTAPRRLEVDLGRQRLETLTSLAAETLDGPAGEEAGPALREGLALLRLLSVQEGWIEGSLVLAGTAERPANSGAVSFRAESIGLIVPADRTRRRTAPDQVTVAATRLTGFEASLRLQGNTAVLERLRAASSTGGRLTGGGTIGLGRGPGGAGPQVNLFLDLDRLHVVEKDLSPWFGQEWRGSGIDLVVDTGSAGRRTGPLRLTGRWPAVTVSGTLRVPSGSLPAVASSETRAAPEWGEQIRLDLAIVSGDEVWLRNPLVRLRLGGQVLVRGTAAEPDVRGVLTASEGVINLPLLRLRQVAGTIRLEGGVQRSGLAVVQRAPLHLDLTGHTTFRVQRALELEPEYVDAVVTLRGSPSEAGAVNTAASQLGGALSLGSEGGLTLSVRTDPPLPGSEIEALIRQQFGLGGFEQGGTNVVAALRGQVEQALTANIAPLFTDPLETRLRSTLGLEMLSLDIGVNTPLRVRIGRRLFGPVYGVFTQRFGQSPDGRERTFELYYRINPRLRVGFRQEEPLGDRVFFISGTRAF